LSSHDLLKRRVIRSAVALSVACSGGLTALICTPAPAAAAGAPEAPITEVCAGPLAPGTQQLCGTLNPGTSAKAGYYFAYNVGTACTADATTATSEEVEGQALKVSSELTGLQPGTQYAYCLVATSQSGEAFGNAVTFTTPGVRPPEVPMTEPCGGPLSPGALRMCGTLNPNSTATTGYYFAYNAGGDCLGGSKTPAGEVEGESIEVSDEVSGLPPSTEYTYCLVATSPSGEASGRAVTLTTAPLPPAILSETASAVTQNAATLEAQINSDNQETSYLFQYGTSESLGAATIALGGNIAPGFGPESASVFVASGLVPRTTYYYRAVATNSAGTTESPIQSFVTPTVALQPPGIAPGPNTSITTLSVTPATVTPPAQPSRPLTRAQKLAITLKRCKKQPLRRRASCKRLAHKAYGMPATETRRG
jgi:hypothetical protein